MVLCGRPVRGSPEPGPRGGDPAGTGDPAVERDDPGQYRREVFRMRRWIRMADSGYMNGDTHVHFLDLRQSHLQMRVEDLEVLNLLTSDFTNDAAKFTGRLDAASADGHWVYVGQEFRDWQQGHLNLCDCEKSSSR